MGNTKRAPGSSPMPPEARRAALATFARIIRERHPGVAVLPLSAEWPDGAVGASAAREVVTPFSSPEDRDTLVDRHAGAAASDDRRVH